MAQGFSRSTKHFMPKYWWMEQSQNLQVLPIRHLQVSGALIKNQLQLQTFCLLQRRFEDTSNSSHKYMIATNMTSFKTGFPKVGYVLLIFFTQKHLYNIYLNTLISIRTFNFQAGTWSEDLVGSWLGGDSQHRPQNEHVPVMESDILQYWCSAVKIGLIISGWEARRHNLFKYIPMKNS